jgi:transcriptional regulator with GAF, ATPase, and Fis domain
MNLAVMQRVTLDVAGNAAVGVVLDGIVRGISECKNVALCRIWLVRREPTADGERKYLRLAASAGNLKTKGVDPGFLDGRYSRFEIGQKKVGRVAATGQGVLVSDLHADEPRDTFFADPQWIASESILSFAAQPLIARGETVGVIAVFDRATISEADFGWLRTFADHAAVAILTARAFEEIESLKRKLELENDYLREEVTTRSGSIHGLSLPLQKVLRQIEVVAATGATVLITGESGVGKELVARAIHDQSDRAKHPLIRVNCAAIPSELFESEFFGHTRGSFTGALRDRVGRFELADHGTIFLDEIGEVPLQHQAKLLRVLQEGTLERVGDERTRKVDVRVIAATNRDLAAETAAGRFRADLYYRLSVFPIEVPPLRERRDDIAQLAEHFLARSATALKLPKPRLTRAHLDELARYDWPGNVRELEHVVERALIQSRGGPLPTPRSRRSPSCAPRNAR